jgi:feruloyl esterase
MRTLKAGFLSAAAAIAVASPWSGAAAQDVGPVESCDALAALASDRLVIETATLAPAGPGPSPSGEGAPLPEHCLVRGMIDPRVGADGRDYGVGFEVRMPTSWNGRFAFQGGGGLDGVLNPALGDFFGTLTPSALARGFAVVSSDGGHRSERNTDGSWGVDQQARLDYAFGAVDKATLQAKALVERYYGAAPARSYFLGCSNGGRQGLVASQRMPLYFDGIVAGDPGISFTGLAMNHAWSLQTVSRIAPKDEDGRPIISRAFSDGDLRLVADAVSRRCDDLDGLADGMINDWIGCDFDPGELVCAAEKTDACLTEEQVVALRDMQGGPRNSRGEALYGFFAYDTGIANGPWRGMHLGSSETGAPNAADVTLGSQTMGYYALTPPDPTFDLMTFDFDRDPARLRQSAAIGDGDSTYLETFARRGKMIVYHGLSDQGMATGALTGWYDRLVADTGAEVRESVRLFLVPGMGHCGGGLSTDRFDMIDAIVAWVEEGRAPDRIIATGDAFPAASRPLCPYPQVARYEGGDENDAASFACRE